MMNQELKKEINQIEKWSTNKILMSTLIKSTKSFSKKTQEIKNYLQIKSNSSELILRFEKELKQWKEYQKKYLKEYHQRPEVKSRMKKYYQINQAWKKIMKQKKINQIQENYKTNFKESRLIAINQNISEIENYLEIELKINEINTSKQDWQAAGLSRSDTNQLITIEERALTLTEEENFAQILLIDDILDLEDQFQRCVK